MENREQHLEDAAVLMVPLFAGSGNRVKILLGRSRGTPVVTASTGCEGIVARRGRELLIAKGADTFVEAMIFILES